MTWDEGQLRFHRPVTIGGVQVGMAYTACQYLDQNFAGAWRGNRYLINSQGLAECAYYDSWAPLAQL